MQFKENLMGKRCLLGSELSTVDQRYVLSTYVYRFTKDHKPVWASGSRLDGKPYYVQFASDQDWLEHTLFEVTKTGRVQHGQNITCESHPTWPDGQD